MTNYNIKYKDDHLAHGGKKGMKWGYNDGKKNGKRTAEDKTIQRINEYFPGNSSYGNKINRKWYTESYLYDKKRFEKRLKKHGVLDRFGTTLLKYGLNKIGTGRLDDKLEWRVGRAKNMAKNLVDKMLGREKKKPSLIYYNIWGG